MSTSNTDPRTENLLNGFDQPMWIDGEKTESSTGEWREVRNPAIRESVIARVPAAGIKDVDRAVDSARKAFGAWRGVHFTERARALAKIADDIEARAEDFAKLTSLDTGNALRTQARPEVTTLVALFRYFSGIAGEVKGTTLPAGENQLQYTRLEPLGVVACILPWNSPLMIAGFKIPAALAAGNTVILKAADDAPLTILLLAEICNRHLPAGVLNALTGRGSVIGQALSEHPGVDKVSFTGSTDVGRGVARTASERLAHVSLELGGKNPSIVFPDAVDDELIDGLLAASRFTRQGQSCTAGSRLFLHEDVYDEVLEKLTLKLGALKVGDPLDEATDMGAIINASQHRQISDYLQEGRNNSALTVALGGDEPTSGPLTEGYFHQPTVFGGASNDFRLAQEEIFGPVLVAIRWKEVDEVVKMANDSHYGLAAYVWSHNLDNALNTAHRVEAGWVQVNQGGGQVVGQSYGGYKQSGIGREVSLEGMLAGFTQTKQINVKLRG
ncbi:MULTISPECIES: aldehyde dehydrogenase family protein [Micrococcaceae]|uniref:aldehyde dehydrogenase family protein n=1 Tax=Micrococcaceae TaxID=1268 RepID=UPI001036B1FC|nr:MULTISPECIES: aldehyde dehydrogenase family protein [Micrococcaceae]TAP28517.1 aldehyde dehydrogenase family protein [Arthrobacter sp. S41]UXN32653.1 aldehyde dehydrogenase family protein [Glutamicibacter sp. M10]